MICGLDTMTVIWGLRDVGKSTDPDMERRAGLLLRQLDADEAKIVISAVTVAELLTPLGPREQNLFVAELNKQFEVAPFDVSASSLAADLYRKSRQSAIEQARPSRKIIRADTLIVASLKRAGATIFYSNDRNCRTIAEKAGMVAHDLPTHSEKLFE